MAGNRFSTSYINWPVRCACAAARCRSAGTGPSPPDTSRRPSGVAVTCRSTAVSLRIAAVRPTALRIAAGIGAVST